MGIKNRLTELPRNANFFLFGPRQTGKSTLIKDTFSKSESVYYDLLLSKEYTRLAANPSLLREEVEGLDKKIKYIIIDEVQKIPELLDEIHYLIENSNIKRYFCLSGSSARKLKRVKANLLGGRAWIRNLYPLTHLEIGNDFNLTRALQFGTLPAIYLNSDENAKESLEAYTETYLEEEIKAEAIVRNIGAFVRFLKFAAYESGNIINFSNISRETATSHKTIKEYFQILEDTLVGYFLLPYSKSTRKRLVKHPKFYLFDTGVRNALAKRLSLKLEPGSKDFGDAFEHFIITEMIRLNKYKKKDLEFSFYNTSVGAEVDLIIETPSKKIYAIEIKSRENPSKSDLSGLKSFLEIQPNAVPICLSRAPRKGKIGNIMIYPWKEVFELLDLS